MTQVASEGTASIPSRSFARRVFAAQESGLVLVIILLMAALTIFGGTKVKRVIGEDGEVTKISVNRFLDVENLVLLAKDQTRTLPLGIADMVQTQHYQSDWGALFAGLVIVMLPVLVVYWIFRDKIHETMLAGAVKG